MSISFLTRLLVCVAGTFVWDTRCQEKRALVSVLNDPGTSDPFFCRLYRVIR